MSKITEWLLRIQAAVLILWFGYLMLQQLVLFPLRQAASVEQAQAQIQKLQEKLKSMETSK